MDAFDPTDHGPGTGPQHQSAIELGHGECTVRARLVVCACIGEFSRPPSVALGRALLSSPELALAISELPLPP